MPDTRILKVVVPADITAPEVERILTSRLWESARSKAVTKAKNELVARYRDEFHELMNVMLDSSIIGRVHVEDMVGVHVEDVV